MNEFTVLDKQRKSFYDGTNNGIDVFQLNQDGTLSFHQNCYDGEFDDNFTNEYYAAFPHIGKTDMDNKKIYADSSIIEFILKDETLYADFTGKKPTICNEIKMIGYFTYNNEDLRYEIVIIDWEKNKTKSQFICLYYNNTLMSNFKIIDTIQENKLRLIK